MREMRRKVLTCIRCPSGCELQVEWMDAQSPHVLNVAGNMCSKGCEYAVEETVRPLRTVTTTVCLRDGIRPLVSVRTAEPVPKASIEEILDILRPLTVAAPVRIGQILVEDVAGTGVPVVATRSVSGNAVGGACL